MSSFDVFVFKSNLAIRCRSAILSKFKSFICFFVVAHSSLHCGGKGAIIKFVLLGFDIFIGESAILAPYIYALYSIFRHEKKIGFQICLFVERNAKILSFLQSTRE